MSRHEVGILAIYVAAAVVVLVGVSCLMGTARVQADQDPTPNLDDGPATEDLEDLEVPDEVSKISCEETCWIADLTGPVMAVPEAWAKDASAVIACESRWNALAVSPTGDYGLFQLNRRWQEGRVNRMGYAWADVFDARVNTLVAIAIWESWGNSWRAWSCRP